jgi:hypothetical protein
VEKKGLHAARVEKSKRLQRVLVFLGKRGEAGATTREIQDHANLCAVNTAISELRKNGYRITCTAVKGKRKDGARIYKYVLVAQPGPASKEADGDWRRGELKQEELFDGKG